MVGLKCFFAVQLGGQSIVLATSRLTAAQPFLEVLEQDAQCRWERQWLTGTCCSSEHGTMYTVRGCPAQGLRGTVRWKRSAGEGLLLNGWPGSVRRSQDGGGQFPEEHGPHRDVDTASRRRDAIFGHKLAYSPGLGESETERGVVAEGGIRPVRSLRQRTGKLHIE